MLYTWQSGAGAFVTGPATLPEDADSPGLQTPGAPANGSNKVYLFNYEHMGTRLSSINAISYSTYRSSTSTAPAYNNDLRPGTPADTLVNGSGRPVPASKDACKNGGWQTLYGNGGTPFKNQGQCVQYFSTGK